jgi:hypothetical protein
VYAARPPVPSPAFVDLGTINLWSQSVKRLYLFASIAFLFVLSTLPALAQFETASVLGYVRDGSGAALPGASVTLTNVDTKTAVTVVANGQGGYQFTDVKVGRYQVSGELTGFDVTRTEEFSVQVNARQRVNVTLKVGSASETVQVTAAAALLETDSSDRGQVIGTREVQNLPLNGRE